MSLTEKQRVEVERKINGMVNMWLMKCPPHIDRDDARSAAWEGVCKAADRYNGKNGASFATYAYIVAKGAMLDWFRKEHMIVSDKIPFYRTSVEWNESYGHFGHTSEDNHGTVLPEHTLKTLQEMPKRTQEIFIDYFGEGLTHKELADKYGVSEGRMNQIFNTALLRLRAPDYEDFRRHRA